MVRLSSSAITVWLAVFYSTFPDCSGFQATPPLSRLFHDVGRPRYEWNQERGNNRKGTDVKLQVTNQGEIGEILSPLTEAEKMIPTVIEENSVASAVSHALSALGEEVRGVLDEGTSAIGSIDTQVKSLDTVGPLYTAAKTQVEQNFLPLISDVPAPVTLLVAVVGTYSIVSFLLSLGKPPSPNTPYPTMKYDADAAEDYYDTRVGEVLARSTQIAFMSIKFGLSILVDFLGGKLQSNQEIRATELCELLTVLGPSFIKIGQSLSIRTDILSPAYQRGLKSLQDQVPAFDTVVARRMIEEELGQPVDKIFSEFSSQPVAAASLGQVYRAKLRSNGKDVAVKVQRPNILNQIALDMHVVRQIAPVVKRTFNLNTDYVGIVDVWATGFVEEIDYLSEAENAKAFMETLKITALSEVVFAPKVVDEYTSEKVLVTEWVEGERLDKSAKDDVTVLCSIAMNSYLTMMLETGVLHCDPHPGNLLRTPDGKLCILDWGMVTKLNPDLQVTLIEHMAHLTSADYDEIPEDLLKLGFIPERKADLIKDSGLVETLADIYGAWTSGGGAASVDVNKVITQLQDLTAEKGNLFQIPPYFAYIAKSFSVLEGIGLSNDPKYSIINECLPYVSKRLLTDNNPRTGGALNTFIFGPEKSNADRIIDYDRVEQLITGFGDYTTSASGELINQGPVSRKDSIDKQADRILELLVTEEDTALQSIVLEQLSKIISSSSRSIWSTVREASGTLPSGRSVLGTIVDPLGFWRTSPLVRVSDLDQKTIETTRSLIALLDEQNKKSPVSDTPDLSNEEVIEISRLLVGKIWDKRSGVIKTGGKLAGALLQLTADKLEKGERDVLDIPQEKSRDENTKSLPKESLAGQSQASGPGNTRLESARKLLSDLENNTKPLPKESPAGQAQASETGNTRLESARKLLSDLEEMDKKVLSN